MKLKKILALAVAVMMVGSMGVTAFAEDAPGDEVKTGQTLSDTEKEPEDDIKEVKGDTEKEPEDDIEELQKEADENNSAIKSSGNGNKYGQNREERLDAREERLAAREEKRAALAELKQKRIETRDTKIELLGCLKEARAMFRDMDIEDRDALLDELAAIKEELKDYSIGAFVNGLDIDFSKYGDVKPEIQNGRTLVPIRAITESMDAVVTWDEAKQEIIIEKDDVVIIMDIDSLTAFVNDEEFALEVAPRICNGRTMVPMRFIAEALGLEVEWDKDSRTIIIE